MKIYNHILLILFCSALILSGQNNLPRLSPKSFVGQTIGYTNVIIEYGSPGVKERAIWGKLVPYNEVWRTGANEATTIEFDNDVIVEGNKVPAGKYSLFTIPGKKKWTIIFNKVYEQWGAYKYDISEDLIRFNVIPEVNEHNERLKFSFEYIEPYNAYAILEWDTVKIIFSINSNVKN
jgi:hypothetical protein